ncbi:MAG: 4-hydroxy-tetrahydrodipicolinate synthase [Chloroflexota bacterium]
MTTGTSQTTTRFEGAFTALITPFRRGELDEQALRQLVDFQIAQGINGLVPCGTTGESVTLTEFEHDRVIEMVVEQAAGRVPVIAGTGTNNTRLTIERTHHARAIGADAALVVVPYYNKPTQEGMYRHFAAIAEATDLPLILYNVPGRTGVNMTPETVLRLAEIPTIVGIKEASGNLDQVSQIVGSVRSDFVVLSGDDSLTLPIISLGGRGVISVVSNIVPAAVAELTAAALRGDLSAARSLHHRLVPLCRAMFLDNNPTAVKTAAGILGLCSGELRLPLTEMTPANRQALEQALRNWGFPQLLATAAD